MRDIDIYERCFDFACRVLRMDQALSRSRKMNRNTMVQLVSASTSFGANLEEARAAQSRADFHSKVRISLKEARESLYWLRLLMGSGLVQPGRIEGLVKEANEIVAILTTIAKKSNPRGSNS